MSSLEAFSNAGGSVNAPDDYVSLKTLKTNLKEALKKSGVLNSVKAQIRKEFISNLAGSAPVSTDMSESDIIFRSALFYFLKRNDFTYTLSVYAAECGIETSKVLSEDDLCQKLQVVPSPGQSVLEAVLSEMQRRVQCRTVETASQSDYSGAGIREMLDSKLRDISTVYQGRREQERLFPARSTEERMLAFQRDCEKRLRDDFESQLRNMRDIEMAKVRLEEAHLARAELEATRAELESIYERRLAQQSEREAESLRAAAERERLLQQTQFEQRQRLQRELDDLRSREQTTARKLELDHQGLRLMESRLKEAHILLETREKEVARREREAETLHRELAEKAREEARLRVQDELESLLREKNALKSERSRLESDRSSWEAVQEEAAQWRVRSLSSESALADKEEEVAALKGKLARLEIRQRSDISEVMNSIVERAVLSDALNLI